MNEYSKLLHFHFQERVQKRHFKIQQDHLQLLTLVAASFKHVCHELKTIVHRYY